MKAIILHIIFSLLAVSLFGQTQLLEEFDFNEGGYYILGTFSESDKNDLQDSLGEFYTDDITVLNQFKDEWIFTKLGKRYACGYHYNIYVCKNGLILKHMRLNLNCDEIVSEQKYFYFNSEKLRIFKGKLKKPFYKDYKFENISKARKFRGEILKSNSLIMVENRNWTKYEGEFQFKYECKKNSKDCYFENIPVKLKEVEEEIRRTYPNEIFELKDYGGGRMSITFIIKCNKTLSDKFNLYLRDYSYFGKWKPYKLDLKTYWIKEQAGANKQ